MTYYQQIRTVGKLTTKPPMPPGPAIHRWDGIEVEKVTEMISRYLLTETPS